MITLERLALTALTVLVFALAIWVGNNSVNSWIDEQREQGNEVDVLFGS